LNGQNLAFMEFVQAAAEIRANSAASDRSIVGVYFDLTSGHVTRITLRAPR
jgi:hypothetical protein